MSKSIRQNIKSRIIYPNMFFFSLKNNPDLKQIRYVKALSDFAMVYDYFPTKCLEQTHGAGITV